MSDRPAAEAARNEATQWIELVDTWRRPPQIGVDPAEAAVVRFYDPTDDLHRRMAQWGYEPGDLSLSDLALFAAGLAKAEAEAWQLDNEHIATQAYAARRFLLGDRILHWAIPWLRAVEPVEPIRALAAQLSLLGMAESHRPAPLLVDGEGLTAPGEDSLGPVEVDAPLSERLLSVWSGQVLTLDLRQEVERGHLPEGLADTYAAASVHWQDVAGSHPGSARLWRDLSRRAARTAEELR